MTPLEVFAVLVLAGAVVVLLYYYLQDNRKLNLGNVRDDATHLGERVYTGASNLGDKVSGEGSKPGMGEKTGVSEEVSGMGEKTGVSEKMSEMGEKINVSGVSEKVSGVGEKINVSGVSEKVSGVGEKINVSGVSEKMSGMGDRIRGISVPSTDTLSSRIDLFLNEQSDRLIEDWDLATKKDLSDLEKRFNVVSLNFDTLEKRFNEYRGATNTKLESIEKRLEKLETPKITTEKTKKITTEKTKK
ncbi:MAG: hypothetical protein ACXVZU_00990 [Methanobacteriaceae archaeon]